MMNNAAPQTRKESTFEGFSAAEGSGFDEPDSPIAMKQVGGGVAIKKLENLSTNKGTLIFVVSQSKKVTRERVQTATRPHYVHVCLAPF